MKKYIRIMRLDHWIKQLFILPGTIAALFMDNEKISLELIAMVLIGLLAVSFVASANYVINEWFDAEFDKFHPTKKNRSVVTGDVKCSIVRSLWICLALIGIILSYKINIPFLIMSIWLWIMGILYNVKPIRTKDIPFVDVLSESINNAIRLIMGWFIVSDNTLPPISLVFGYWMAGAFLMATKRLSEYMMIGDKEIAASYRKSFKCYNERILMVSSFFYGMCSVFFIGIFLIKYKIELVIGVPIFVGLYCYYFSMAFDKNSSVQRPEKLFKEKALILYGISLIIIFSVLMIIDIPWLETLTDCEVIKF